MRRADRRLCRVVDELGRGAPSIGEDTTGMLVRCSGSPEADIESPYADTVVHRTEPFIEPQAAAVDP
jgi:hypothetical protein